MSVAIVEATDEYGAVIVSGSNLALSSQEVASALKKLGGTIVVESEPRNGTTFRIKLPISGPNEVSE